MSRLLRCFLVGGLTVIALAAPWVPASARALLKPNGREAMRVFTRSVSADVLIDGQFSTTKLTLVFQNESPSQMEADFIYTLPPGAVATYFAYWAGKEKVVARIVEKKQAAAIYQRLTTWSRDPALVEIIGKNTFRARIFPVFANQDLKVELHIVQALPSDVGGVLYSLPLGDMKQPDPLDSIDVTVRIEPDEYTTSVTNNYGLPVTRDVEDLGAGTQVERGYKVALKGANYRPEKDLNVRIARKKAPLQASLYARPSGGKDGFFALALVPDHSIVKPRVTVQGVETYDVTPSRLPDARAHRSLTVFGRYKGGGKAEVILTGVSAGRPVRYSRTVSFGTEPVPENLATKLWAQHRIADLGRKPANREAVTALSKRYTLPSPYTSWLAVPKAEMETINRERISEAVGPAAKRLAELIGQGQRETPEGQKLEKQFSAYCEGIGVDPKQGLQPYVEEEKDQLGGQLAEMELKGKGSTEQAKALLARFSALCEELGLRPDGELRNRETNTWYRVPGWIVELIAEGKEDSEEHRTLKSQFDTTGENEAARQRWLKNAAEQRLETLALEAAKARYGLKPDAEAENAAKAKSERLATVFGLSADKYEQMYGRFMLRSGIYDLSYELAEAFAREKRDLKLERQLRTRIAELCKMGGGDPGSRVREAVESALWGTANQLVSERHSENPDMARIASLARRLRRIEKVSGRSSKAIARRLEAQSAELRAYEVGHALAERIASGKGNDAAAKRLRQQFKRLCLQAGRDPATGLREDAEEYMHDLVGRMLGEKYSDNPDRAEIANLQREIARLEHLTGAPSKPYLSNMEAYSAFDQLWSAGERLITELTRPAPSKARLDRLRGHYGSLVQAYGKLHADRRSLAAAKHYDSVIDDAIEARMESVDLAKKIEAAKSRGNASRAAELAKRQTEVRAGFDKLLTQMYAAARYGDPLISVDAPADARQVIALLPNGEIKVLEYDPVKRRWEGRFDIPTYAAEGDYVVTVIVVLPDGTRKVLTLRYRVDTTPPGGTVKAELASGAGKSVRLEVDADEDTARVVAVLPWGERLEMKSSSVPHRFFALAPLPSDWQGGTVGVTLVLTDKAHNRTTLSVEVAGG